MDVRRKKLFYRAAHRGIKEMDLILSAFAVRELEDLDGAELDQFEALLEVPDQELYLWVTGAAAVPDGHATALMDRLKASNAVAGPVTGSAGPKGT